MPKKYFRKFLPSHETIQQNRWIRPYGKWLHFPGLWHLHRRSVAGGVAVGLLCGLVPGPFQMLSAALLSVTLRVNLPVSLFVTLYTNPFTIVPIYWVAYQLGILLTGEPSTLKLEGMMMPELTCDNWIPALTEWFGALGRPFLVGLPVLGIMLAIAGYILVRLGWRCWVIRQWQSRGRRDN